MYSEKEILKLERKQEIERKTYDVYQPFSNCLHALLDKIDVYFTYKKTIETLRENLGVIKLLPKDNIFELGKKDALKRFKKNGFKLTDTMNVLIQDPEVFLENINDFHKKILLDSIDPFYDMWFNRVKALKRKDAKTLRQQYVLDGYITLKLELMELNPSKDEIANIEIKIEKLKSEDWSII